MKNVDKRYAFGPVPSRRLGRSLGVDIVPFKTCTYDCIYCQLGRTTDRTAGLREFYPPDDIVRDVRKRLKEIPRPDYITLSGSGEPTLNSRIGDIIHGIKGITDIPIALLTNGSLLWVGSVRDAVMDVDLIVPSLDAGDDNIFSSVNRPHSDISFDKMVQGLCSLRTCYTGPIWLEVFLVGGMTEDDDDISRIKTWTDRIAPDRVQLNTAVRTPAEDFVSMLDRKRMEEIRSFFGPRCEVIADYSKVHSLEEFKHSQDEVLELLKRRPSSVDDISNGLNLHRNETVKYVQELMDKGLIVMGEREGKTLYFKSENH